MGSEDEMVISVKFTILGAPGVGKTSLRRNFMGENFLLSYQTTLGTDFANKKVSVDNATMNLQIWDMAGQMNFLSVTRAFLSHSHAALLVFDATNEETFEHVKAWLKILHSSNTERASKIPYLILLNKVDLLKNEDDPFEIEFNETDYVRYLDKFEELTRDNVKVIPTSAKTGVNVDLAFYQISKIVKEIIEKQSDH